MRKVGLLVTLLLASTPAPASEGLHCSPLEQIICEPGGPCREVRPWHQDLRLWPAPTAVDSCRAAQCPPGPPAIHLCSAWGCGGGIIEFARHPPEAPSGVLQGLAFVIPDDPPRLYATMIYALVWHGESGRLALSRFDQQGQTTSWFDCRQVSGAGADEDR